MRIAASPQVHLLLGLGVLVLDLFTGKFLLFPILFVVPVVLAGWFNGMRWAIAFAILLPVGRLLIAVNFDSDSPLIYDLANAITRAAVLSLLAYLVAKTSKQNRILRDQLSGFVVMCAWSRTINYQGEWLSFEEYLKRRFDLDVSHGVSPTEAKRAIEAFRAETAAKSDRG
jgi:hypothetical protein